LVATSVSEYHRLSELSVALVLSVTPTTGEIFAREELHSVSVELRTTLTLRLITALWVSSSQEVTQGAVHVAATAQRADRERAIARRVVSEVATVERMVRRVDLAVSQSSEQVTLHAKVLREVSRRVIVAMRTVRIQSMLPSSHRRCV
jgi:hypothetical protein